MALLKVDVGDLIAVPARMGVTHGFVMSRVLRDGVWVILEVFSDFRHEGCVECDWLINGTVSLGERMFAPVRVSLDFNKYLGKEKWPVLKLSLMMPSNSDLPISELEWEGPPDQYDSIGLYHRGDEIRYEPDGVRRSLESGHLYANPQLLRRIDLHLRGIMSPMQALNYRVERELMQRFGADTCKQEILEWVERSDEIMSSLAPIKKAFERYNKVLARKTK